MSTKETLSISREEIDTMLSLHAALRHLRIDLELLYADLERIEANLKSYETDPSAALEDLTDHIRNMGGHLHDAFARINSSEMREKQESVSILVHASRFRGSFKGQTILDSQ